MLLQAEAEIQEDAVVPGQKVVIIDDLLATGGEDSWLLWLSHPQKKKKNLIGSHPAMWYMHLKPGHSSWMRVVLFFRNSVRSLWADEEAAGGDFGLLGRHRAQGPERPGQAETAQCRLPGSVLAATNWYLIFQETLPPQDTLSLLLPV